MATFGGYYEHCKTNEYFVGNISTLVENLKKFDEYEIEYRLGDIAYDIKGNIIKGLFIKPLFIVGNESFQKYNNLQMKELKKIRRRYNHY